MRKIKKATTKSWNCDCRTQPHYILRCPKCEKEQ